MAVTGREIPRWKAEIVEELVELLRRHRVFALIDTTGIPANHIQMLRKKLHGKAVLKAVKPRLLGIALEKAGINPELFKEHLTGQVVAVFTDMNPFELAMLMDKYVTKTYFKPGEKTDKEIVIPEGNTGIPPAPC